MATPLATVGILSIGDMGVGISRLLSAHNYRVITNASDRSDATKARAASAGVHLVPSDADLAAQSDFILSIVPPRDAYATAKRIATAVSLPTAPKRTSPLTFLDLNAVSPQSARDINALFSEHASVVKLIDGAIIGGPPRLKEDGSWNVPSLPVSGPTILGNVHPSGGDLAKVLNVRHISDVIGQASGLKMCFASLTKGLTALSIQSFTTAHRLGVLPELKSHLSQYSPKTLELAERGVVGMPPKAYRWVREMEEIAATHEVDGGFEGEENVFRAIARVYDLVAHGTDLGNEVTESRERGKSGEDVALLMSEGIDKRKLKTE